MSIIKKYQPAKSNCKVTFSYPVKEGVNSVQVLGDFNNWDSNVAPLMKKVKNEFATSIELSLGKSYEFRYLINESMWDNDFNADKYIASPYTNIDNSVLIIDGMTEKTATTKVAPKKASTVAKTSKPKTVAKAPESAVKVTPAKAKPSTADKAVVTKVATAKTPVAKTPAAKPVAKKTTSVKTTPKVVVKDDLKKIEGIGPKIEALLHADGIVTFSDLSKAKVEKIQSILDKAGKRYAIHNPATWSAQAKMAAAGQWVELKKWQDELNGGKA